MVRALSICEGAIASTLKLHAQGSLHLDIKPANMMYDPATHATTIIDMGSHQPIKNKKTDHEGTSPPYIAPEIFKHKDVPSFSTKSDVYALGLTLGQVFGLAKFEGKNQYGEMLKIVTPQDPEYTDNKIIEDPKVRKVILALLRYMTDPDPKKRPKMSQVQFVFQNIENNYLKAQDLIIKTAYLDISEFKQASEEQQNQILQQMHTMDEITLVDHNKHSQKDYVQLKRFFDSKGLVVHNNVVQMPAEKNLSQKAREIHLLKSIRAYRVQRERIEKRVFECSLIRLNKTPIALDVLESTQIYKVISVLARDMTRLVHKYDLEDGREAAKERIEAIKETKARLREYIHSKDKKLTFKELHQMLDSLEQQLLQKTPVKSFLEKNLGLWKRNSRKTIEKLKAEIKAAEKPRFKMR